jgi:hypothetical protein
MYSRPHFTLLQPPLIRSLAFLLILLGADISIRAQGPAGQTPSFKAGAARRDITPREPVPMWGYGARHDALSDGVIDPLYAAALVIQAGDKKLAIVGLDLGLRHGRIA